MKNIKNDCILMLGILFTVLLFFAWQKFVDTKEGSRVLITVDGAEFGSYSLWEDKIIEIDGHNTLVIRDGRADMTEADCPDLLCVKQHSIYRTGESIICLPNKTVVTITGAKDEQLPDVIVH